MKPAYPVTPPRPVRRQFGSVLFDDPFAWLEEENDATAEWQRAQDALATAFCEGCRGFERGAARVDQFSSRHEVLAPLYGGGRWFRQFVPDGQDLAVIEVTDDPSRRGRVVVDLNAQSAGEPLVIAWFSPSPEGGKLAYGLSDGSARPQILRVVDVASGGLVVDGIAQQNALFPAWLRDGRGFYFRADDPSTERRGGGIFRLDFGPPLTTTPQLLELEHPISWPVSAGDGRHVFVYCNHLEPRPHYVCDTRTAEWRPFLAPLPGMFRGLIVGDRFVAITDDGAPRGRVVSIPLATPTDRSTWREVVPPSASVLASLAVAAGRLVLLELVDTYARLRVIRTDGTDEGEIPLPGRGVVSTTSQMGVAIAFMDCVSAGGDDVVFVHSSLTTAPALYRSNVARRTCEPLASPACRLDADVIDDRAVSPDGTPIPYRIVARRGLDLSSPRPAIVYVSGGFNVALLPGWPLPSLAAWIDAGGVLAVAHVRGGGEFGPEWWRAGQLANKRNSFGDLYAVAERLIARGVTSPGQLGVHGISNGGSLAAGAAVHRPDLFRAAVPQLPITDMLALVRDPITLMIARMEDGDPHDPRMSEELHSWSPYHNVKDGVAYPATMIECGCGDPRCPPWHGRKLAARLQRASSSGRPVLLRVRPTSGLRAVGEAARRRQQADVLAFFTEELGLTT